MKEIYNFCVPQHKLYFSKIMIFLLDTHYFFVLLFKNILMAGHGLNQEVLYIVPLQPKEAYRICDTPLPFRD